MENGQKVIFLDIDGVLSRQWNAVFGSVQRHLGFELFKKDSLAALQNICEQTGARIVVISSRLRHLGAAHTIISLKEGANLDPELFFEPPNIEPSETKHKKSRRANAIAAFCKEHGIAKSDYIIIDDDVRGYSNKQMKRLISPKRNKGLTATQAEHAIALLQETPIRENERDNSLTDGHDEPRREWAAVKGSRTAGRAR